MKKKIYIAISVVGSILLVFAVVFFVRKSMYIKELSNFAHSLEFVADDACYKGKKAGEIWERARFTLRDRYGKICYEPSEAVVDFLGEVDYSNEKKGLGVFYEKMKDYPIGCKKEFKRVEYVYLNLMDLIEVLESSTYDEEFSKQSRMKTIMVESGLDYIRDKNPNILK